MPTMAGNLFSSPILCYQNFQKCSFKKPIFSWIPFGKKNSTTESLKQFCLFLKLKGQRCFLWDNESEIVIFLDLAITLFHARRLCLKFWVQTFPLSAAFLTRHFVKSVQIRCFFWSVFSVFGLNTGKYEPEKTPYFDTFHVA